VVYFVAVTKEHLILYHINGRKTNDQLKWIWKWSWCIWGNWYFPFL